jgi:hypothetical protein
VLKVAGLLALAMAASAHAQATPDDSSDRAGLRTSEVWVGYSNSSPKLGVLGNRPGMSFGMAAFRLTHRWKTRPGYAIDYTLDFIPLAMSSPPVGYSMTSDSGATHFMGKDGCELDLFGCRFQNGSAVGAGISPLGLTVVYRRDRMLQYRLGATGGVLMFDRRVPTVISTRFNFTGAIEAGAQLVNRSGHGLLLVYRFHHLSNAGTGYDNSALASNMISLGLRWRAGPTSGSR